MLTKCQLLHIKKTKQIMKLNWKNNNHIWILKWCITSYWGCRHCHTDTSLVCFMVLKVSGLYILTCDLNISVYDYVLLEKLNKPLWRRTCLVFKFGVCKVTTAKNDTIHLSSPTVCQQGCFSHGQYEQWCWSSLSCPQGTQPYRYSAVREGKKSAWWSRSSVSLTLSTHWL